MASMRVNPQEIVEYVMAKHGFSFEAAVGLIANIRAESNFYSDAIGDNGTSGGLFQHHKGRWSNLRRFADRRGTSWKDWKTQVDFAMSEPDGRRAPITSRDAGAFAQWWSLYFERPAGGQKSARARARIAYQYLDQMPEVTPEAIEAQASAQLEETVKKDRTYASSMWTAMVSHLSNMIAGGQRPTLPSLPNVSAGGAPPESVDSESSEDTGLLPPVSSTIDYSGAFPTPPAEPPSDTPAALRPPDRPPGVEVT